jgi:hypothetical protein
MRICLPLNIRLSSSADKYVRSATAERASGRANGETRSSDTGRGTDPGAAAEIIGPSAGGYEHPRIAIASNAVDRTPTPPLTARIDALSRFPSVTIDGAQPVNCQRTSSAVFTYTRPGRGSRSSSPASQDAPRKRAKPLRCAGSTDNGGTADPREVEHRSEAKEARPPAIERTCLIRSAGTIRMSPPISPHPEPLSGIERAVPAHKLVDRNSRLDMGPGGVQARDDDQDAPPSGSLSISARRHLMSSGK